MMHRKVSLQNLLLSFVKHSEFACCKSKAAFRKICILINGRKCLAIRIGIDSYKALIRPRMEYAIPAWAFSGMGSINQFETVQKLCLNSILGAFKN